MERSNKKKGTSRLEKLPYMLCKQHDTYCPVCGRSIYAYLTICSCGQQFDWMNHRDGFCEGVHNDKKEGV